jgi:flagellar biosynthesis protein FlhA
MGGLAWMVDRFHKEAKIEEQKKADEVAAKPEKEKIENLLPLDLVELEVGYGLINVVESEQSGDLLERIVSIRKQFALDMGLIVPSIHIRDNLQLEPGEYRVLIKGNRVGGGILRPDYLLAMDPGNTSGKVEGIRTKEPAFGLDAIWITKGQREEAELAGYTVVDLPTVMATHLTELVRTHAHELLGRQEAQSLIDNFKKAYPKVVEDLIPDPLPLGGVVNVLQNLLREQVSIRDLLTIFETLADEAHRTKDPEVLTESVRKALARGISSKFRDESGRVSVMSLDPSLEELIANSLLQTEQGVQLVMDPRTAHNMIEGIASSIETYPEIASQPILLVSPTARRHISKLTTRFLPQLVVLSHNELASDVNIRNVATVELPHAG